MSESYEYRGHFFCKLLLKGPHLSTTGERMYRDVMDWVEMARNRQAVDIFKSCLTYQNVRLLFNFRIDSDIELLLSCENKSDFDVLLLINLKTCLSK